MTTRERLALAAAVSAGLHALLVSGNWWQLARLPDASRPLEVWLKKTPPAAAPTLAAPPDLLPVEPRRRPAPPRRAAPPANPATSMVAQPAPAAPAPGSGTESAPPETGEARAADGGDTAGQAGVRSATRETTTMSDAPSAEAPRAVRLPSSGEIHYSLTYGRDGFDVGRAVQTWEVTRGHYLLASDAETTGIVDIFRPQHLRWLSKGTVTDDGLRPDSFLVSRTRRGVTEAASARFDWNAGRLTYGAARERTTVALTGAAQDIMSFIYHLSLAPPPPGRFRIPIATGTRFEEFEVLVRPEESIETPLGTLRALPVRQQPQPGAESIEIWLAAEYRYLPVRIRYFDREGKPAGEQVASEIRVSKD